MKVGMTKIAISDIVLRRVITTVRPSGVANSDAGP